MKIKKTNIERVNRKAPMDEREEVLDFVYKNGYSIIEQGPFRKELSVDLNIFHVVAERKIKYEKTS